MQGFTAQSADGTALRCCDWRPDGEPRRHLLLAHGLGEHLGRYEHVGAHFAEAGIRVLAPEMRGHGLSGGRRGHVRRWSEYGADLQAAAELLPADHALYAHSTGALVALDHYAATGQHPQRMVFTSPLVGVAVPAPAWKKLLARPLAVLWPTLPLSNEIRLEDLSTDPEAVEGYRIDALRVPTVTPAWYREMNRALDRLWRRPLPDAALQLHLADDERLIDRDSLARLERAWPGLIAVHRWPARHELHQDYVCDQVLDLAKEFLLEA